jgi:hypothetical protein
VLVCSLLATPHRLFIGPQRDRESGEPVMVLTRACI